MSKTNVPHRDIREQTTVNPTPRRGEMIGRDFFVTGTKIVLLKDNVINNVWRVRCVKDNTHLCVRPSGEGVNSDYFDVRHVMMVVGSQVGRRTH